METTKLSTLNIVELKQQLSNKTLAYNQLGNWLNRHPQNDEAYPKVMEDRRLLKEEINALDAEILEREKPFKRSVNNSFEL